MIFWENILYFLLFVEIMRVGKKLLKIALIDLDAPREEIDEPLGIEMLAGSLKEKFRSPDIEVRLFTPKLHNSMTIEPSYLSGYRIIGISTKLNSCDRTKKLLDALVESSEKPLVVLGNIYGTYAYREFLSRYPSILCVRGEGEDVICHLVQTFLNKQNEENKQIIAKLVMRDVPNIACVKDGSIIETQRKVIDLNKSVLPRREFLDRIITLGGVVLAEASRGCPWAKCKFCAISGKYGNPNWRGFPVEWVISDLQQLSAASVRCPYYTDEDFFGSDSQRVVAIAEAIIAAKKNGTVRSDLNFYFNARVSTILGNGIGGIEQSVGILKKLKRAGLREVFLGIESGSKEQIRRYRKSSTAQSNIKAVRLLRKLGIQLDIGFIMFDPEMSLEELKYNINFLREAGLANHDARMNKKLRIEPFTCLETEMREKGIIGKQLAVDDVIFPYEMQDERVKIVYEKFRAWEGFAEPLVYKLQARSRGECESEQKRMMYKRYLGLFRELDLDYLEFCIRSVEASPKKIEKKVAERKDEFEYRRSNLIMNTPTILGE